MTHRSSVRVVCLVITLTLSPVCTAILRAADDSPREVMSLDGVWAYRRDPDRKGEQDRLNDPSVSRDSWGRMKIPVNWYKTEVGDYHGVIWFSREFDLPAEMKGKECFLRFLSVDYIAEVWLNGVYLGRHEGFFAPFEFHVTPHLKHGRNVLVVKVDSPKDPSEYRVIPDPERFTRPLSERFKTRRPVALTTIKGSLIDHWHRPGWQTQFSQDGNTGGIWQSVQLVAAGPVAFQRVLITPKLVRKNNQLDGTALITVDADVFNATGRTVRANIALQARGKNFHNPEDIKKNKEFVLVPGPNSVKLVQSVRQPALWWCWDHGTPNLYQMRITVATDQVHDEVLETFGIRELVLDPKGHWYLNGKRVFARGMRYHSSIWLGEADRQQFQQDLNRMRDLHINAIRIGSHVEQPQFYDLCDEMGFLVWQVFPMHYGIYADTDDVIERAATMMGEMVRLLYNHPSIGIWSVFKEPNVYFWSDKPNLYGRLCDVMRDAARSVDPIRWVHKGDYEEGVTNVMTAGWGEVYPDFREVHDSEPQKVEFGTVHVAPLETAKQILKPDEQWPPRWDRWYYLNLDPLWMHLQGIDVSSLHSLDELIERSQTWAARQIKESAEYIRQRKYAPNASMFLYFWSDPWPCLGGSGLLDYYRRKYKAYDVFGTVYTPVLASIEWVKDKHILGHEKRYQPGEALVAKLWVTNDTYTKYEGARLEWAIKGPDGRVLDQGSRTITIPEDSSQIVEHLTRKFPSGIEGNYRMEVELRDRSQKELSRNYFDFRVTSSPA